MSEAKVSPSEPVSQALGVIDEQKYDAVLAQLVSRSHALVIRDPETFRQGREIQAAIAEYMKGIGFEFDPRIAKAKSLLDDIKNWKAKWFGPADVEFKAIRTRCDNHAAEEKRLAQVEQDRVNAELARKAQEKADADRRESERLAAEARKVQEAEAKRQEAERRKEIEEQRKAGELTKRAADAAAKKAAEERERQQKEARVAEEQERARAAAAATVAKAAPPPIAYVKPNLPAVAGTKSQTYYAGDLEQPDLIIDAFLSMPERRAFLRRFIMVNEQEVGKFARETKDVAKATAMLPGVKFSSRG